VTVQTSAALRVPFIDLAPTNAVLKGRLLAEIGDLIDSGAFTNGPAVDEFELEFAEYCGVRECVGVASGLDALRLGLLAAGLRPGDGVVVPANTFVATVEAVVQAGGVPLLVDVSESDYNIDVAAAACIRDARFILPVHLYGQLADMRAVSDLAADRGITIVEDACQAHGAAREGIRGGTTGACAAFSFYPAKNLGAMGDAGALVTNDPALAEHVRALREHGQRLKYHHDIEGYTARLDTLQALVLKHKLALLEEWNQERQAIASFYGTALRGVGDLRLPPVPPGSVPVWHLYVVRTADPRELASFLEEGGIATGRHYPQPLHLSPAYARLGYVRGDFPVTEGLAEEILSLPIFPGMSRGPGGGGCRACPCLLRPCLSPPPTTRLSG
jgi:dTDP-4-amino-4,6-dideoxygalactose transaminase